MSLITAILLGIQVLYCVHSECPVYGVYGYRKSVMRGPTVCSLLAYLAFFFAAAAPTKSQNECETILTPSTPDLLDELVDEVELQPLVVEDCPRVPVSDARPLS